MAPVAAASSESINPRDVCIVGVARTPMGGFLGTLSSLSATKLGSIAIEAALKRANVDPSLVQEVYFGNVLSANLGQAPARQAALGAGIPNTVICTTVNKVCASGMKATMLAAQSIQLGINDVVVAGGMESMSNVPKYLADARKGSRFGHDSLVDGMLKDGLWDVYNDGAMGTCAELCADKHTITREDQDNFAIQSFERGIAAQESGSFTWEIVPVEVPGGRGKPLSLALICIIVAGVGGQSPAAAPSKSPATPAATTPAASPTEAPSKPKSPAPVASPKSVPPASSPKPAAPVASPKPATPASSPKPASPASSPSKAESPAPAENSPKSSPPAATPVSSPPAPVPVSSPPAPVPVSSPPAPVPVSSPPKTAPTTAPESAPPAPVAEVPAPAPSKSKKKKKGKKHNAPAPSPALLGPPAPPAGAPGPSEDAFSPGPASSENDESGAEAIRCLKKVLGCLALGWATVVLIF